MKRLERLLWLATINDKRRKILMKGIAEIISEIIGEDDLMNDESFLKEEVVWQRNNLRQQQRERADTLAS